MVSHPGKAIYAEVKGARGRVCRVIAARGVGWGGGGGAAFGNLEEGRRRNGDIRNALSNKQPPTKYRFDQA